MDQFQELGELVSDQCPSGYTQAVLEARLADRFADLRITYSLNNGEQAGADFDGIAMHNLHQCLKAIRTNMADSSGQKWDRCVFVIFADGRFKIDVSYDD